jgi:hypothetical protein
MAPTAAQIAQLRRMIAEPTTATYDDTTLTTYIENYPCVDENGESPRVESTSVFGAMMANPDWTETYDLHMAAAALWEEKAAAHAAKFDFNADGGNYSKSQQHEHAMQQVRHHLARRNPSTIILVPSLSRERTYETNQS